MELRTDLVPAKEQDGQKTRFEKESENPLRRQRAAKNIADKTGIGRPVRAKLKFHHDAGGDTERKSQREDLGPEPGHLVIKLVAGPDPKSLHDDQVHAETDAQRGIDVMKGNGKGELNTGEEKNVHGLYIRLSNQKCPVIPSISQSNFKV